MHLLSVVMLGRGRWLLAAAETVEKAYSRIALLLTPSVLKTLPACIDIEVMPKDAFLNREACT